MAKHAKNEQLLTLARTLNHVPWCDEYEKMISGMLYDSFTPMLGNARFRARRWCHKYNNEFPSDIDESIQDLDSMCAFRTKQLEQMIGKVGAECYIEPPFNVDYGSNITLGDRFYANFNLIILDCSLVTIGDRVMLGPNVSIFAATHETTVQSRRDNIEYALPVTIGNDVWIGGHVVILPGITIGDGVTVAAGSIVTKDIASWSVVMGQPARVVRKVPSIE